MSFHKFVANLRRIILSNFPPKITHYINVLKNVVFFRIEPELDILSSLSSPSKASIDVGAHLGLFSYVLAKSSKVVFCFEPQKQLFEYLKSIEIKKTILFHCALSDFEGELQLRVPIEANSNTKLEAFGTISPQNQFANLQYSSIDIEYVKTTRMDSYNFENIPIGFIKIDVEGHEMSVLRGGTKTITQHRPKLLIEISEHFNQDYLDVFNFLYDLEYDSYIYNQSASNKLLQINIDSYRQMHLVKKNFIFIPKS